MTRKTIELVPTDPARIELWSSNPPPSVEAGEPAVLGGDWDLRAVPFEETSLFRALRDRFVGGKPWEETPYWDDVARIEAGEPLYGCRSEADFRDHLAYVDDLYSWITEYGYLTARELGPPHDPDDEITVGIGRDGRLIAFSRGRVGGRHRLAIARLLELPEVPVRVLLRHAEWVARDG